MKNGPERITVKKGLGARWLKCREGPEKKKREKNGENWGGQKKKKLHPLTNLPKELGRQSGLEPGRGEPKV